MTSQTNWQKSTFSGGGDSSQCVEISRHDGTILIRESDDPTAVTATNAANFAAFVKGVKAAEFDHFTESP